jgi:stage III sporulation protein AG
LNELIEYIKRIKIDKKTMYVLFAGVIGIVLIFFSEVDLNKKEEKEIVNEITDDEYCSQLENKIESFIENIDGAGKTEVIITLSETTEYIYAKDGKEVKKSNEKNDDNTLENNYVIIKNNNNNSGLLIKTIEPKIRGVAVSCEGGDKTGKCTGSQRNMEMEYL